MSSGNFHAIKRFNSKKDIKIFTRKETLEQDPMHLLTRFGLNNFLQNLTILMNMQFKNVRRSPFK